jgi:hypothetical protein
MKVTNYTTGEIIEIPSETQEQIMESLLEINQTIKLWESAYKKLKGIAEKKIDHGFEHNGYKFYSNVIQRQTYDMNKLREVFDEDELWNFMELKKTAVDNYIKDHLDDLGEKATMLRKSMIESGNPYSITKLEKL